MERFLKIIIGLTLCVLVVSCSALLEVGMTSSPKWVGQRGPLDCAVASLAMVDHVRYEDVIRAERQLGIAPVEEVGGTRLFDIIAISARLGVRLEMTDDPTTDGEGILIVWERPLSPSDEDAVLHAVYLKDGVVYDPLTPDPIPFPLALNSWVRMVHFLRRTN